MKKTKPRPGYPVIKVRFLIFFYIILCVLTVILSRNFFIDTLHNGEVPGRLDIIVFFTIPAVLIIYLGVTLYFLLMDFIAQRPGSRFNARLIVYFLIIVIFSILPATIMTGTALNEIVVYWQSINTSSANRAAGIFIAENYTMHMERFENIIRQNDFALIGAETGTSRLPQDIASVQVFMLAENEWKETSFTGEERFRLGFPPSFGSGFTSRELPRDTGTIRYTQMPSYDTVRIISYNLGEEFDAGKASLENQINRFETINLLRSNVRPLLFYYYAVFFLPTLLMTIIIAITFTRRITNPIVELTEATRKVAEGDFSVQILTRRNDELGNLIRSFNIMVQDLEKTREALLKNEKISIWQNMAQQLAHEIKNPLTPIKLSAERVLRRWRSEPQSVNEILESSMMAIIKETESLSVLLDKFRTLSKPTEGVKVWTHLKEPMDEVINAYTASYPYVKFDVENIDSDISVKIDKNRLSQVLTNLIINAIDAMNNSGLIEIRTDIVKKRDVCYCRISIKDSGKGISESESKLVFTPYYTSKESGTGLGLPIIERIVTDHDGAIWFDSAEGMGTTFYIDLPAEKNEPLKSY